MKFIIYFIAIVLPIAGFAKDIRVLSMNMHCALGDWEKRTTIVIDEIVALDPDVIGFQEICYNDKVNMKDFILNELNKRSHFESWSSIRTHRTFVKYQEELFIISKNIANETIQGDLPAVITLENKYVGLKTGNLGFITTHLHFALPQIRKQQYEVLKKFSADKTIIFGDMNSNDRDSETNSFKKDGWLPIYSGATYPSHKPTQTFDGFWISPALKPEILNYKIERIFLNAPVPPSDHLGVLLSLEVKE